MESPGAIKKEGKRESEREREKEREGKRGIAPLKGMTVALAPLSYLTIDAS
jgi:hypothetical protein